MRRRRTYWHLEALARRPSDYEVGSTRLMFAPAPGSSVAVPMAGFYRRHGPTAQLTGCDWEAFRDPAQTTYARYVERQRDREVVLQTLCDGIDASGYDHGLTPTWRTRLGLTLSALRFPAHALQMLAAYLGRLAPASPIVIAFTFHAADELRRVQRYAYRLRQLVDLDPSLPQRGRDAWQDGREWQPLRRLVERLLVTHDWVECFVATCLVFEPLFDELTLQRWPQVANDHGDALLPLLSASLHEDARWHRELHLTLAELVRAGSPDNAALVAELVARWRPLTREALEPLAHHLIGPGWLELTRADDLRLAPLTGGHA